MTPANRSMSIIIVTWNGRKYVEECLESLRAACRGMNAEVIVVDNASSDGTPSLVRKNFPFVRLVENSINLGFARANNVGIRLSTGKYVCLINSDVNVPEGCIQRMNTYMDEHSRVGLIGPRMLNKNGYVGRSYMRFPTLWRSLCASLGLHSLRPRSRWLNGIMMTDFDNALTSEVEVLNGWFLMARREALDEVGLLDERFFMYGEDIDWSYRFHQSRWKKVYLAEAGAVHYGGASSSADPTRFYIEMQRANLQFWRKYHGRLSTALYRATIGIHQLLRVAGYGIVALIPGTSGGEFGKKARRNLECLLTPLTDRVSGKNFS